MKIISYFFLLTLPLLSLSQKKDTTEINLIFADPEVSATFPGGMTEYAKYLMKEVKYPKKARKARIEGKVFIEFFVEVDGKLTNFKVVKGIGGGCDEEAIRVLKEGPKWVAGKINGEAIRQMVTQVFLFELP